MTVDAMIETPATAAKTVVVASIALRLTRT